MGGRPVRWGTHCAPKAMTGFVLYALASASHTHLPGSGYVPPNPCVVPDPYPQCWPRLMAAILFLPVLGLRAPQPLCQPVPHPSWAAFVPPRSLSVAVSHPPGEGGPSFLVVPRRGRVLAGLRRSASIGARRLLSWRDLMGLAPISPSPLRSLPRPLPPCFSAPRNSTASLCAVALTPRAHVVSMTAPRM